MFNAPSPSHSSGNARVEVVEVKEGAAFEFGWDDVVLATTAVVGDDGCWAMRLTILRRP